MPLIQPSYEYRCEVARVVDGDTVDLLIDLGLQTCVLHRCRLYGINAPEVRGESRLAGHAATSNLQELCDLFADDAGHLLCRTIKDKTGKYGRYLVTLIGQANGKSVDLNARMIADGHAVAATY